MTLNEFLRLPEMIPPDKRLHALIGVVFGSTYLLLELQHFFYEPLAYLAFTIALAWGIEIYQKATNSGNYDNLDALAVVIGSVFVYLPYFLK